MNMNNGQMPCIIPDGYQRTSFIEERPLVHGRLTFTWRPTTDAVRAPYIDLLRSVQTSKAEHEMVSRLIDRQLVMWNLADEKSAANIAKLQPTLWKRLADVVVWGDAGPDGDDPLWEKSKQMLPLDPDASIEEMLAKNSETEPTS